MTDNPQRGVAPAVALAVALVGWSLTAGTRKPWRNHPMTQAAMGSAVAMVARAPLGLRPPALVAGLRVGLGAAVPVVIAVSVATAMPTVRAALAEREPNAPGSAHPPWRWLTVEIPLGTVWSEEMAFRGGLARLGAGAFGPTGGRLLQSATFGLSHVADARATGQSVLGTVLVTGVAGWAFDWLRERSGSLVAPMLAHLAINEAGAAAVVLLRRRT